MRKLLARIAESILFGSILEIVAASVIAAIFGQESALSHLHAVFQAGNSYMDSAYFTGDMAHIINHHIIAPISNKLQSLGAHVHIVGVFLEVALLGFAIFLQKLLIAFISIPVFLIFVIVGAYDGLIHRELRRYRVGIESTKREHFEFYIRWLTRLAFIGFVSTPLYINAPLWFMAFGVGVGCFVQQSTSFIQKYW